MSKIKIIAWNVNGVRSLIKNHDMNDLLKKEKPTIFCMGETKLSCPDMLIKNQLKQLVKGYKYREYSTCKARKGYSGTAVWSKKKPLSVLQGLGIKKHDQEGRVITCEFDKFYLTHVYTPNSGQALQRLKYRTKEWDVDFWKFVAKLEKKKPVIVCGDLNVARYEIDLHSPKTNLRSAGFTIEERTSFNTKVEKLGMIDAFRHLNPDVKDVYSYWSYMRQSRKKNKGWRIDLFLASRKLEKNLKKSGVLTDQLGSDHAPITLELSL